MVFGLASDVTSETVKAKMESKLKEIKANFHVECVLGPLHSAEIVDGPDRQCMVITLSAAGKLVKNMKCV